MGATRVIAIDLTVNHPDDDDEESPSELKQILDELFNLSDAKGIVGWLFNRPDFKKYRKNCKDADVYINPPLYDYDAADFSRQAVINMIGIGEKAARQKIETLRNCKP
jgi:hypothetical protein